MKQASKGGSTICVLVTTSPESEDRQTLARFTEAALGMGHKVQIFLMCDGVYHILLEDFQLLMTKGAEVTLCSHNARERGVGEQPGVLFGSQYDLAHMVSRSDAFWALT
jgi:sulfur relay (sulfurtransferase) complex TusBCD TusD component (DsrE family)